jgi:hypothetical protein
MGLQFYGTKPPRPDSARARLDTPPIHFVAGGEILGVLQYAPATETAKFSE